MPINILTSRKISALPHVTHGFFGREGGVSEGVYSSLNMRADEYDDKENVSENKTRVLQELKSPNAKFQFVKQIHSDRVIPIQEVLSPAPEADGLVTGGKNIILGVLTADCCPVLFSDKKNPIIGACHSGWRGSKAQISIRTIEKMEALGSERKNIIAAIGPCIGSNSYEVSEEFYENFLKDGHENKKFFKAGKPGHFYFNMPGYIKMTLENASIGDIEMLNEDTLPEKNGYFSYRRNTLAGIKNYGCQVSAIGLK